MSDRNNNLETIKRDASSLKLQMQKILKAENKKIDDRTVRLYSYALLLTFFFNHPFGLTLKDVLCFAEEYNSSIKSYIKNELSEKVFGRLMSEVYKATPEQFDALKYILADSSYDHDESTPESITKLALKLLDIKPNEKVADLGSGNGSFLFLAADQYKNSDFFGYEISSEKYLFSMLMNHIRSNESKKNIQFENGDVFDLESKMSDGSGIRFDKVFSNYPFGMRLAHSGIGSSFLSKYKSRLPRIEVSGGEGAFNLLIERLVSWSPNAKGVAVMSNGFTWNATDKLMRKSLLESGMVEAVISLPPRLFEYSAIPTTIMVFSYGHDNIRMVDATRIFTEGRRQNILSEEDIDRIYAACNADSDISRLVPYDEIWDNEYVLNPVRYLSAEVEFDNGVKLGNLLSTSIVRGAQLSAAVLDNLISKTETDYQYLMLSSIHDGIIDDELPYLKSLEKNLEKYCIEDGDIILSKNGYPFKVAIAHPSDGKKILANGSMFILRVDSNKVNPVYLKVFLESEKGTDLLKRISVGSSIPNISQKSLEGIHVPLPSIEEQEKIARQYTDIQDEIRILRSRLAKASSRLKELV